jgi:hypothetical protein
VNENQPIEPIHFAEQIKKSVLFIGSKENGVFRPRATAFAVSMHEGDVGHRYLVTADHVISNMKAKNLDIWIRGNKKDGTADEHNWSEASWIFHPNDGSTDVAIATVDFTAEEDFKTILVGNGGGMAGTQGVLKQHGVNVGHEVLIAGLFRSHYGRQHNVPIIRTGNIAMMLGEKVYTKHCGYTDAYLVEARSIAGLSGSPVFVKTEVRQNAVVIGFRIYLLGLMHGHFDVQNLNEDVVTDTDSGQSRGINTGIGVVIPVEKILETLNQPEVLEARRRGTVEHRRRFGAAPDAKADGGVNGPC